MSALATRVDGLVRLVTDGSGVFALTDAELVALGSKAKIELPRGEPLDSGDLADRAAPAQAARLGSAWLVRTHGEPSLAVVADRAKPRRFAKGSAAVEAFAASASSVAVARLDGFELWSAAGKRRWRRSSEPIVAITLTEGNVLALDAHGALVFASKKDGARVGTLRLASPELAQSWRLEAVGGEQAVLALGEWLVWVDASTRKTVRRVKARAKVRALATDARWVVAGLEDGWIQAFDAATGEVLACFEAHHGAVNAVALAGARVYGADGRGQVRTWDRDRLTAATHAPSPVAALGARGDLVAAADKEGHVHLARAGRHVGSFTGGHPVLSAGVDEDEGVWAATPRAVVCAAKPWTSSRPIVLRTVATAVDADDAYVFAGTEAGAVDVFDRERGVFVTTYEVSDTKITAVARLPGALLAVGTGGLDGGVIIVDVTVPEVKHRVEAHGDGFGVTALAADARGRIVASGSEDGLVALIDPARGRVLGKIDLGETPLSLAFEPAGLRLACALADGTAALVSFGPGGALVARPKLRGVTRVAWGRGPVAGFADGTVHPLPAGDEAPRARR